MFWENARIVIKSFSVIYIKIHDLYNVFIIYLNVFFSENETTNTDAKFSGQKKYEVLNFSLFFALEYFLALKNILHLAGFGSLVIQPFFTLVIFECFCNFNTLCTLSYFALLLNTCTSTKLFCPTLKSIKGYIKIQLWFK